MSLSIFITGGTSGIGLAIAEQYLSEGHQVAVCGRSPEKFNTLKEYENATFYQVDVVSREEIITAIGAHASLHGLDIVIANAGIGVANKTTIPDFEKSRDVIDTNLTGTLNTFEGALKIMLPAGRGHLVGISSVAGLCGFSGVSSYSAAKAGVIKLCEGYGIDLYSKGIDVTCIAPGFVDTPLTRQNNHPMPFIMTPEKAAKLITKAIEKKKAFYSFPFFFSSLLKILAMIPRGLYKKIFTLAKVDFTKN